MINKEFGEKYQVMLLKASIVLLIVCPAIVKGVVLLIELTLLIPAVWILCDPK